MTLEYGLRSEALSNHDVAETFHLLADLLSIRGDSIYKVSAYRVAADSIDGLPESLAAVRRRGGLEEIPGVGKEIAQKISDLLDTGTFPLLQEVEAQFPRTVAELLAVPGVGPKRARELYQGLGIDRLESLREAIKEGRLDNAPGFGLGVARRIAEGLGSIEAEDRRLPLGVARSRGLALIQQLMARAPQIQRIELAGSIRRFRETIGDFDIAAAADDPSAIVEAFVALPLVSAVERRGENRCRVTLQDGVSADLWVLPERYWGSLLHHVTGTREHNIRLRDLALERGAHLSEYGYTIGEKVIPCATEEEVYSFLDMQYVPPTMRQNTGEIDLARKHALPAVIGFDALRGDLHAHSTWSDGTRSIREMAGAAKDRGYEYVCITDHSRGLAVANGLDAERLKQQRIEIDGVNAELAPFRVLQGIELEVRADGSLDLDDDVLAALDIVVAAVHSGLRQDRATLTHRAVSAIGHPLVDVLAHPTGRMLGHRPGGDFDMDALYAESARTGTVLEIDGDPARLDLRDVQARAALAAGCTLSIDSDAHSIEGLENVYFGIGTAQRAWAPPERVFNALPLQEMLNRLKRNR
jgi:DNA polymerase (family 10)